MLDSSSICLCLENKLKIFPFKEIYEKVGPALMVDDPFLITYAITHIWSAISLSAKFFPCTAIEFGRIPQFFIILVLKT